MLSFDDTCKRIEKMALKDEDEIKTAFLKTQVCLIGLFSFQIYHSSTLAYS